MSKFIKRLSVVVIAFTCIGTLAVSANAAACGNWYLDIATTPFCEDGGCGFLWSKPSQYQNNIYKRKCVSGPTVTTETKVEKVKIGCC